MPISSMSAGAVQFAASINPSYFENMKAFLDSDKEKIRQKIIVVFGDFSHFNSVIVSATVQSNCSRLTASLLLWIETTVFCLSLPIHVATAVLGLVLSLIVVSCWRVCCLCSQQLRSQFVTYRQRLFRNDDDLRQQTGNFGSNILMLCFHYDLVWSALLIGMLMCLPVSIILCSMYIYSKAWAYCICCKSRGSNLVHDEPEPQVPLTGAIQIIP